MKAKPCDDDSADTRMLPGRIHLFLVPTVEKHVTGEENTKSPELLRWDSRKPEKPRKGGLFVDLSPWKSHLVTMQQLGM